MYKKAISGALKLLCGDFNGLQVFWAPATLIYLIDSASIFGAIISALGIRISYLPLIGFALLLGFTAFMLCKLMTDAPARRSDKWDAIISLNLHVFALVGISTLVFAVSALMQYFYGLRGILKPAMELVLKVYPTYLIFSFFLYHVWQAQFPRRNLSRARAKKALFAWVRSNPLVFIKHSLLVLLLVLAVVKLYELLILLALYPAIDFIGTHTGYKLQLSLGEYNSYASIILNSGKLLLGLLISNLIFSPFVLGVKWLSVHLTPQVRFTGKTNA